MSNRADPQAPRRVGPHFVDRLVGREPPRSPELDDPPRLLTKEQAAPGEIKSARSVHVHAAHGALAERVGLLVPFVAVVLARIQPVVRADVDRAGRVRGHALVADGERSEAGFLVDDEEPAPGPAGQPGSGGRVQTAVGGLVELVDARAREALLPAEFRELTTVESKEAVVRACPQVSDPVLEDAFHGRIRDAVVLGVSPEREAPQEERRLGGRRRSGGRDGANQGQRRGKACPAGNAARPEDSMFE